jgi:hypothetical protein
MVHSPVKWRKMMSKTNDSSKLGRATQDVGTCTRRELRDDELQKVSGGFSLTIDGVEVAQLVSRAFGGVAGGGGTGNASWDLKKAYA